MLMEVINQMDATLGKVKSRNGGGEFQLKKGLAISIEMIKKIKNTPGVHGIQLMVGALEEHAPFLIEQAGLPRPVFND